MMTRSRYCNALGEDHPRALTAMENLGVLYRKMSTADPSYLEHAAQLLQAALKGKRDYYGDENEEVLDIMSAVAWVVSGAFPSRARPVLTEIYLCHARSCESIDGGRNARRGSSRRRGSSSARQTCCGCRSTAR
jgi:hypothetical protein